MKTPKKHTRPWMQGSIVKESICRHEKNACQPLQRNLTLRLWVKGPVHTMAKLNFERRSVWANGNAEMPKVRPLSLHTRSRCPKDVASKMLDPNFRREPNFFLETSYFNILFQPTGLSSRHSLVRKSDASPLNLGTV